MSIKNASFPCWDLRTMICDRVSSARNLAHARCTVYKRHRLADQSGDLEANTDVGRLWTLLETAYVRNEVFAKALLDLGLYSMKDPPTWKLPDGTDVNTKEWLDLLPEMAHRCTVRDSDLVTARRNILQQFHPLETPDVNIAKPLDDGNLPQQSKVKRDSRAEVACELCAQKHEKCYRLEGDTACQRCIRKKATCVFASRKRKRNKADTTISSATRADPETPTNTQRTVTFDDDAPSTHPPRIGPPKRRRVISKSKSHPSGPSQSGDTGAVEAESSSMSVTIPEDEEGLARFDEDIVEHLARWDLEGLFIKWERQGIIDFGERRLDDVGLALRDRAERLLLEREQAS